MKKNAFSLIELMIVVAIIAFLAMIAVPQFTTFLAKAKRAEAYTNLRAIYAAEQAYKAEHGTYTTKLSGPRSAGWRPEGYRGGGTEEHFHYTYGFPGSEGTTYFTGKLGASVGSLGIGQATKERFVAVAAGDIDGDGKPDILSVDETGMIRIVEDDLQ